MSNNNYTITENDLQNALANDQFFLAFQPIMNLKSNNFETFEAFVRWNHPVYGELLPASFIQKIQECNLAEQLTKRIIDCAITQILNNYNSGYGETGVNINLTVQEFLNPNTLKQVSEAIEKIPNPVFLGLEISSKILSAYSESNPEDTEYHPDCVPTESEKEFLLNIKTICDKYIALGVTLALDTTDNIIGSLIRSDILGLHAIKLSTKSLQNSILSKDNTLAKYTQASKDFCIPIIAMGIEEAELFQNIYTNNIIYAQGTFFCPPLVLNDPSRFQNHLETYLTAKNSLIDVQHARDSLKELVSSLSEEQQNIKEIFPDTVSSQSDKNQTENRSDTQEALDNSSLTPEPAFKSFPLKTGLGFGNRQTFGKKNF
jgi:EAL domain-containing protein (putative c-di-GMP-specific phosphodiesterase class I)